MPGLTTSRTGAKLVASRLHLSQSLIHKWSHPRRDGRSEELNPLDRLVALAETTGDARLVEWVCARLGGCFMPNPPAKRSLPRDWLPLAGAVLVELGRFCRPRWAPCSRRTIRPARRRRPCGRRGTG